MKKNLRKRQRGENCSSAASDNAASWGREIANALSGKFGHDAYDLIPALGWKLVIAPDDLPFFPFCRLAAWEGDTKTIRIFPERLRRLSTNFDRALRLACAHEFFHGLLATKDEFLSQFISPIPPLTCEQEEAAATAFAHEFAENFRLTLGATVRNFI